LALDGNNLKAFNVLGISLIEMGKYDQTMERINEGLKHIGKKSSIKKKLSKFKKL